MQRRSNLGRSLARMDDGLESETEIDEVIAGLDSLFATSAFELAYKTGEFLIARLYSGDLECFRSRGKRQSGYRRLVSHPKLRLSPSALWRSLRVYELCQRFPWLNDFPHLRVTHLYAVLGLPDETQEQLLREAVNRDLDPMAVERQAKPLRETGGRGRPRIPPVDLSIRYLKRFLEYSSQPTLRVDSSAAAELRDLVHAAQGRLKDLEKAIAVHDGRT